MTTSLFAWPVATGFTPQASCGPLSGDLLRALALSDAVSAVSCFAIPCALAYLAVRRTDLADRGLLILFAVSTLACGTNHGFDVWTLWHPADVLQGALKAVTAVILLSTAILLWGLVPGAGARLATAKPAVTNRRLHAGAEQGREGVRRSVLGAATRERLPQQRRCEEARWRAIMDSATEGLVVFDEAGTIETVNPAIASMFGYSGTELPGRPLATLIPNADLERMGQDRALELVGVRRDGSAFPLEIAVGRFVVDDCRGGVGIVRDISQRKASEATRREKEKCSELALVGADLFAWDWNIATGRVMFNDRWAATLGYAPADLQPTFEQWEKLVHPDDLPRVRELLAQHMAGQVPLYEAEHRLVTRAGDSLWVLARGRVLEHDSTGAPLRASGTHMAIADRKRRELRLSEQQAELARARELAAAAEVAAMMAHELNQPLAALTNYLGGAKLRFESVLREHPQLDHVMDAALRLSDRAADVVASIRSQVRRQGFSPNWIAVQTLLEETVQLASADLHRHRVRVVIDAAADSPPVWGQLVFLKQLLHNLVLNAVEAMRGTPVSRRVLTLAVRQLDADELRIDVTDRGAGIPPDVAERMFKPFVSTKPNGMGLGLAICRSIVDLHGGRIDVDSVMGEGATFHATLPIRRGDAVGAG